jgi:hypothetical protein
MSSMIPKVALASFSLALGCGSAQANAGTPAEAKEQSAPPNSVAPAPNAEASAGADSPKPAGAASKPDESAEKAAAAKSDDGAKPAASDDEKGSKKPREVTFQMTPTGLVIEVEGVRMEPKAQALRIEDKDGKFVGWGVSLKMKVTATDSHVHRFTRPEHGALMVAAELDRKGKKEQIGDERKGDGEETVTKENALTLDRDFKKPIASGQSVTLFVGLWGLGRDTEEKRLIRKLFVVKMVAGNKKPTPVVSPPE